MNRPIQILADCQRILASHLPPDGISERACISALLGVLDNPEVNALTRCLAPDMASRDAHATLGTFSSPGAISERIQQLEDEKRALISANNATVDRINAAEEKAQRFAERLESTRQHETHLIQERDRLIVELVSSRKSEQAIMERHDSVLQKFKGLQNVLEAWDAAFTELREGKF